MREAKFQRGLERRVGEPGAEREGLGDGRREGGPRLPLSLIHI